MPQKGQTPQPPVNFNLATLNSVYCVAFPLRSCWVHHRCLTHIHLVLLQNEDQSGDSVEIDDEEDESDDGEEMDMGQAKDPRMMPHGPGRRAPPTQMPESDDDDF